MHWELKTEITYFHIIAATTRKPLHVIELLI